MQLKRLSVQASLFIAILTMGLCGILLVWAGGGFYRQLVLDNQRAMLSEQIRTRLTDWRRELDAESQQLALLVRADPALVAALTAKKIDATVRQLDILFDRPGMYSTRVKLAKLQVLDEKMNELGASTKGVSSAALNQTSCFNFRMSAASRIGTERDKPVTGLCTADKNIYHLHLVPLSERGSLGYLLISLDMTSRLTGRDNLFALPTRITFADGTLLYLSPAWPRGSDVENYLEVEQALNASTTVRNMLNIAVSQDIRLLNENFANTERLILAATTVALLFILLLLWITVQKTAVNPLRQLLMQLRKVRTEKNLLDKSPIIEGNAEVAELSAGINEMTGRLKEFYESFESLAFTDPLTKLPNRTVFHDRLEKGIEIAKQDYKPFALFLMDLDRFKDINDTLGHPIGDLLLQQVAARLRSKLRDIDTIARMGGDEFAILLPAVNDKHAAMAARMLLQALRAPFQVADQSLDISASIGVALYPDHGVDANILIQRADVAMYAAKNANSGHAFYDSKLDQHNP
ncbi:MAG: diguanylate cyclase, partial [Gammaproteobacteria bacterium]|nr:diguanylate cyclase [Gammaproteobacteria bacterium]